MLALFFMLLKRIHYFMNNPPLIMITQHFNCQYFLVNTRLSIFIQPQRGGVFELHSREIQVIHRTIDLIAGQPISMSINALNLLKRR